MHPSLTIGGLVVFKLLVIGAPCPLCAAHPGVPFEVRFLLHWRTRGSAFYLQEQIAGFRAARWSGVLCGRSFRHLIQRICLSVPRSI